MSGRAIFRGGRYVVAIDADALDSIRAEIERAGDAETGGILVGIYADDGSSALVLHATSAPSDSEHAGRAFLRGTAGLDALLADLWRETGGQVFYLGDWHSHPQSDPRPSATDRATLQAIADNPKAMCPEVIGLIVGGPAYLPTVSVYSRSHGATDLRYEHGPLLSRLYPRVDEAVRRALSTA